MTDHNLTNLLQQASDRVQVGAPPIAEMIAGARRERRRRMVTVALASAAAVVATVGGAALLAPLNDSPKPNPDVASPSDVVTLPGTRLVGLGHAAIAVPTGWGTNKSRCGTPQKDTVVIDVGAIGYCAVSRPARVESVEIFQGAVPTSRQPKSTGCPPSGSRPAVGQQVSVAGRSARERSTSPLLR